MTPLEVIIICLATYSVNAGPIRAGGGLFDDIAENLNVGSRDVVDDVAEKITGVSPSDVGRATKRGLRGPLASVTIKTEPHFLLYYDGRIRGSKPPKLRIGDKSGEQMNRTYVTQPCGVSVPVSARSDMEERCPEECPLFVAKTMNNINCDFACVGNSVESCKSMNPKSPVPDLATGECRRCEVVGCDQCVDDGTDTCAKCLSGYVVSGGQCHPSGFLAATFYAIYALLILVGITIFFVVWWAVDLGLRQEVNGDILKKGLETRERAKLHQPKGPGQPRRLWPWNTNLCRTDVAGPAVLCLYNFQVAVIIWASVLGLVWWSLGFIEPEMAELGTREAVTSRQDCINVKWGHHTQNRLMWLKVSFLEFAYLFSFIGAVLFGIRQRRIHRLCGVDQNTHKDYAISLHGMPEIKGHEKVEDDLTAAIKMTTNERLIGVSVGWQLNDMKSRDLLQATMSVRLRELAGEATPPSRQVTPRDSPRDSQNQSPPPTARTETNSGTGSSSLRPGQIATAVTQGARNVTQGAQRRLSERLRAIFVSIEAFFVKPSTQKILSRGRRKARMVRRRQKRTSSDDVSHEEEVQEAICSLNTASLTFVVFETQKARDEVLAIWKETPLKFKGVELCAGEPDYEPSAVLWQNLAPNRDMKTQIKRTLGMSGFVAVMIGLLCLFEYIYYHVQLNAVLTTGAETMTLSFLLVTGMVAGMMAVLCVCSAEVSDLAAFERVGTRETCFVILYTFSVIIQVALDLVIAYWIGKHLMDVTGMRTYQGDKFSDMHPISDFVHIFEAYAMQKQLGVTVLSFGFPCAFLVPFLLEPVISIYVPYKLMSLIVRTHPEIRVSHAEDYLEAVPMDLGRYGDIMINVIVASLILWFPGGFTFTIFMFLAVSHIYIYWYDHYRMLNCCENIYISSLNVDLVAQWLFGVAVSIIAAAVAFKTNCQWESSFLGLISPVTQLHHLGLWGSYCDDGKILIFKVVLTFFLHLALHTVILVWVIPKFDPTDATKEEVATIPYRVTAMQHPCSWFSANLVHCLRSEYVYEANPPFDYCVSGKEHLMRYNTNIGALFTDSVAARKRWNDAVSKISTARTVSRLSTPMDSEPSPSAKSWFG